MDDEVEIAEGARRSLRPWFDDAREMQAWAEAEVIAAADDLRMLRTPPRDWPGAKYVGGKRDSLRFIETTGNGPDALLLFDCRPELVELRAAWTRCVEVVLTRHARERIQERIDELEPDENQQRRWLEATVDRALREDRLTLNAPRWAASAPLQPGLGWTTRMLNGDQIALLVAAPSHVDGPWKIVTVLSKSTAISPLGRLRRQYTRTKRLIQNRIKFGTAEPQRPVATRPPTLGDLSKAPRRGHHQRRRRSGGGGR